MKQQIKKGISINFIFVGLILCLVTTTNYATTTQLQNSARVQHVKSNKKVHHSKQMVQHHKQRLAAHRRKTQATTHRRKTQATTHRRKTQATTHRRKTQATTHRRKTQVTAHRRKTQATAHRRITQATTHRRKTQVTAHRRKTQATAHRRKTQATTHRRKTQATAHRKFHKRRRRAHYSLQPKLKSAIGYRRVGYASWYGGKFNKRRTSFGGLYNMYGMTAASMELPFGSWVKVTSLANKRSVYVQITDRGPFSHGRIIDLSYGAAKKLGILNKGIARVDIQGIARG